MTTTATATLSTIIAITIAIATSSIILLPLSYSPSSPNLQIYLLSVCGTMGNLTEVTVLLSISVQVSGLHVMALKSQSLLSFLVSRKCGEVWRMMGS